MIAPCWIGLIPVKHFAAVANVGESQVIGVPFKMLHRSAIIVAPCWTGDMPTKHFAAVAKLFGVQVAISFYCA
jgi:hypothetical protein